jgi:hypothetical protein
MPVRKETEGQRKQRFCFPYNNIKYCLTSVCSGTAFMVNKLNYIKFGTQKDKKVYDWHHSALLALLLDYLSSRNSVTGFVMSEASLLQ